MALLDESPLEGERLLQWMRCVCVGGGGGEEARKVQIIFLESWLRVEGS